jgi:D-alanyl-D-alanine carboxypeptidase
MTVLDAHQNLSETVPLSTKLRDALPKQLSRKTLIDLALVNSNNRAAQTLCEQYPGGFGVCIYAMNQKLTQLGMIESIVYEPTGLDKRNMSTARDLVRLVVEAKKYPEIIEAAQKSKVEINSNKKKIIYNNTNPMVGKENILVSKTGWISASGGCIVLLMNNKIIILLGSRNTHTRIPEAKYLAA